MYWKYGEISDLARKCELRPQYVHDIIRGLRRPMMLRAELLSEKGKDIGKHIPAEDWANTKESKHEAFRGE